MKEHLGTVVPVGTDQPMTIKIPGGGGGAGSGTHLQQGPPQPPLQPPGAFKLVGSGDEHHILTTPGTSPLPPPGPQQAAASYYNQNNGYPPRPPKFSVIVNEYMGACMEDHCNIGKMNFFTNLQFHNKLG